MIELDYHPPEPNRGIRYAAKACAFVALVCWLLPLLIGIGIFLIWLFRRSETLEYVGFTWLGIGTLFAIGGALSVLIYFVLNWWHGSNPRKVTLIRAAMLLILLASNFAAAYGILQAVDWVQEHHPTQADIDRMHDAG